MGNPSVAIDPETFERVKEEARRRKISVDELVRRSLAQTLGTGDDGRPWMRHAGAVESGDSSASATIDQVVYGRESR